MPPPKHKRSTDEIFNEPQRLHKVLASCGFGSRRAMEEMILAGRITVNRMPAEVGQKVGPADEVRINGELVKVRFAEPRARVLMYHKPAGELVTRDDPEGRPTVFEKLPSIGNGKWINVGRLDYNTEGLLLFTNSGELANRLMHPRYEVEREYAVRVMGRLTEEQMQALTTGVQLDDGPARCEKVADGGGDEDGSNHWYTVVLKEGRNREVRRLFEALGLMMSRLIRTRYGMIGMPTSLKRGDLAELEAGEVNALVTSAGLRSSAQGSPARHERGERREGRPDARKGGFADGARQGQGDGPRSPHKGNRRPHGSGKPHGQGAGPGAHPRGNDRRPKGPFARAEGTPDDGQRPLQQPGRPENGPKRGPGFKGDRAQVSQRPGAHGQGQRPPRARHNFDEVQPQSNANASPFGRSTLTVPGGGPRGYGNDTGPRHRSGPRAHAKYGSGNGAVPGNAHGPNRRGGPMDGFKGSPRGKRHDKRPGGEVNGNVARGEVNGNVERSDANANGGSKGEANGNIAPVQQPFVADDEA